jgi:glycosyltransferase involved in cell wall biosynthesis
MGQPVLSVVIPTRDRRQVLTATLATLGNQVGLPGGLEVIVVDDGSGDGTPELLAGYSNPSFTFRWLAQAPSGPAAARNRGVALAAAARVLLLGDDNLPAPGSLEAHLQAAGGREVAVQGRIDWDPALEQTPVMRFLAPAGPAFYFRGLVDGQVLPWSAVLSSNMSAPTRFLREEPFDERYPIAGFEDTELAFRWSRRGFETVWSERAVAWHRHRYDALEPFLDRQRVVGGLARSTVKIHPAMAWRVILLPLLVAAVKAGRAGASRLLGRGTVEQTWDLRCRGAYLRGLLVG